MLILFDFIYFGITNALIIIKEIKDDINTGNNTADFSGVINL